MNLKLKFKKKNKINSLKEKIVKRRNHIIFIRNQKRNREVKKDRKHFLYKNKRKSN